MMMTDFVPESWEDEILENNVATTTPTPKKEKEYKSPVKTCRKKLLPSELKLLKTTAMTWSNSQHIQWKNLHRERGGEIVADAGHHGSSWCIGRNGEGCSCWAYKKPFK